MRGGVWRVKFYWPEGAGPDSVSQPAPAFPVRTPDGFMAFVRARARGPGQLIRLPLFLARHPEAVPALPGSAAAIKPPASYATCRYYAIHSFRWLDEAGGGRWVRYRWIPEAGGAARSRQEAQGRGPPDPRGGGAARPAGGAGR